MRAHTSSNKGSSEVLGLGLNFHPHTPGKSTKKEPWIKNARAHCKCVFRETWNNFLDDSFIGFIPFFYTISLRVKS